LLFLFCCLFVVVCFKTCFSNCAIFIVFI
jgi:hypothetical protein